MPTELDAHRGARESSRRNVNRALFYLEILTALANVLLRFGDLDLFATTKTQRQS
jgi:hypothetical protein